MKITPKAIGSYLARPDRQHHAILLYGPDSGLARMRARNLTETLLGKNYDPLAVTELTEARLLADPALLADELSTIGLLAPKRVILIRGASDKLTRILTDAAACFHDGVWLIACAEELSLRSSLRAWFEKETICAALACYRDEARDVQEVVRLAFDTEGIRAERDVMEYLAQQLGSDRGVTCQEVEKLVTYTGEDKQLRLEDAQALVGNNRETGFDDVSGALADRDVRGLEKTLALLLREGMQPVGWLRSAQRYFNRLYYIRSQIAAGQNAEQVIQALRPPVFFRHAPILARHVQNWNTSQIVKALSLLAAAELAAKTSDLPPVAASSRKLMQVTQIR